MILIPNPLLRQSECAKGDAPLGAPKRKRRREGPLPSLPPHPNNDGALTSRSTRVGASTLGATCAFTHHRLLPPHDAPSCMPAQPTPPLREGWQVRWPAKSSGCCGGGAPWWGATILLTCLHAHSTRPTTDTYVRNSSAPTPQLDLRASACSVTAWCRTSSVIRCPECPVQHDVTPPTSPSMAVTRGSESGRGHDRCCASNDWGGGGLSGVRRRRGLAGSGGMRIAEAERGKAVNARAS